MTQEELDAVQGKCDAMHGLLTDVAVCSVLTEVHRRAGDASAVEGCQQTLRTALAMIDGHLSEVRKAVLP